MSFPLSAEVLIVTSDEATARRWAAALRAPGAHIRRADDDLPDPARLDLVVADGSTPLPYSDDLTGAPVMPGATRATRATRPGVVRVGGEGSADVQLPADATDRELRLACRLLAEVVRLRRRDHARRETERRLTEEALTDPLTGLPNRRAWDRALEERMAAACEEPGLLCLAIVDLDHFKRVNDAHGHAAGDAVLRAAGEVIAGGLRATDFVARLGGDEFGLLLAVRDASMAWAVVDRVRRGLPAGLAERQAQPITASAGFQTAPCGESSSPPPCPGTLFAAADDALRKAKRLGRDRTVGGDS